VTYLEGMEKPVLLQIPETDTKKNYEQITPAEIREKMQSFWNERGNLLRPHVGCGGCRCAPHTGGCGKPIKEYTKVMLDEAAESLLQSVLCECKISHIPYSQLVFRGNVC